MFKQLKQYRNAALTLHKRYDSDSNLCGVVDTLEGMPSRDLDRLEKLGCANLMKFNTVKKKAQNLDWGNSKHKYSWAVRRLRAGESLKGFGR